MVKNLILNPSCFPPVSQFFDSRTVFKKSYVGVCVFQSLATSDLFSFQFFYTSPDGETGLSSEKRFFTFARPYFIHENQDKSRFHIKRMWRRRKLVAPLLLPHHHQYHFKVSTFSDSFVCVLYEGSKDDPDCRIDLRYFYIIWFKKKRDLCWLNTALLLEYIWSHSSTCDLTSSEFHFSIF